MAYRKFAVRVVSAVMVIVQVRARPEQVEPLQPFQVAPAPGTAVTVIAVPLAKLLPVGLLLTLPLPFAFTTNLKLVGGGGATVPVNEAFTAVSAVTVKVHVRAVPMQPPVHPANVEPAAGAAVSVTEVPCKNVDPAGLLLTIPAPVVLTVTL